MAYIICFIVGVLFVRGHDFLCKFLGIVLICISINPFVISLTHKSIIGNIHSVINVGDTMYKIANDSLSRIRK